MNKIVNLVLGILVIFSSCGSEIEFSGIMQNGRELDPPPLGSNKPYIISSLVSESFCGSNKRQYTLYASSGANMKSYDRELHVGIVSVSNNESNIVESKIIKLSAFETKTENVGVFNTPIGEIDDVKVKIFAVVKDGHDISNEFELRETTMSDVDYCGEGTNFSGGCVGTLEEGLSPADPVDEDEDGLCDGSDPDINDNGIPDDSEDNNDNGIIDIYE